MILYKLLRLNLVFFRIITQEEADRIEAQNSRLGLSHSDHPNSDGESFNNYDWSSGADSDDVMSDEYDETNERKGNRKPRLKHRTRQDRAQRTPNPNSSIQCEHIWKNMMFASLNSTKENSSEQTRANKNENYK